MDFPEFDLMEFRRHLYALWPTVKCTLDFDAVANSLGVSPTTVRRWLNNKQRVPLSVWRLTWLQSSGKLPDFHGWNGWLFTRRWDKSRDQYGHWLAAHPTVPNTPPVTFSVGTFRPSDYRRSYWNWRNTENALAPVRSLICRTYKIPHILNVFKVPLGMAALIIPIVPARLLHALPSQVCWGRKEDLRPG